MQLQQCTFACLPIDLATAWAIYDLSFKILQNNWGKERIWKKVFFVESFQKESKGLWKLFFKSTYSGVSSMQCMCFLYTIKTSCILSPFLSSALISKQAKIQYGFLPKCDRHSFQAIFNLKDENIEGVKKSSKFSSTRCHCSCHVKFACLPPCLLFCTYTRWFWHFLVTTPLTKVFLLVVFLNYKINKYCESHLSQFYILAKLPLSNMAI